LGHVDTSFLDSGISEFQKVLQSHVFLLGLLVFLTTTLPVPHQQDADSDRGHQQHKARVDSEQVPS
jgi:hypothetical protein